MFWRDKKNKIDDFGGDLGLSLRIWLWNILEYATERKCFTGLEEI